MSVKGCLIAGALSAVVAGSGGAFAAWKIKSAFDARTILSMQLADQKAVSAAWQRGWAVKASRDKIVRDTDVANAQAQARVVTVTQEIIRKVPVYVTAKDDARCTLPVGFVRLLDAAGLGISPDELPNRTAEPDSADSGIPLSQATALLAQDLGDAAGLRQRLENARATWAAQETVKP